MQYYICGPELFIKKQYQSLVNLELQRHIFMKSSDPVINFKLKKNLWTFTDFSMCDGHYI
jgi:hypothetical protein